MAMHARRLPPGHRPPGMQLHGARALGRDADFQITDYFSASVASILTT